MKERPILFSGPMVNALLAGRKFVTRRLSKQWLRVKAGDRLWVRETHWINEPEQLVAYRADGEMPDHIKEKWRPSIHMPRWASRILLECEEDARLERLQDISDRDAQLEGMESCTPADQFRVLWNSLHTKPGERWEDNPEVVRVGKFRRIQ